MDTSRSKPAKGAVLKFQSPNTLKDKLGLGYHDRLCLEVCGDQKWNSEQARMERYDVEVTTRSGRFSLPPALILDRIHHWPTRRLLWTSARTTSSPVLPTADQKHLYEGLDLFVRFRETTIKCYYPKRQSQTNHSNGYIQKLYNNR